jgi:hypothetical protein
MTAQFSLAFLLALPGIFPQSVKPNFSGRWQFDEAQSTSESEIPPATAGKALSQI